MSWESILKNKREYYPSSFLEKVQQEGLEQELSKVEEKYKLLKELYGNPHWWIVEIIEDGDDDGKSAKQIISIIHRYIDNDMDEDKQLEMQVEEEMRTMPNLRMIPQPSKEWDNIKARMIEERRGNI